MGFGLTFVGRAFMAETVKPLARLATLIVPEKAAANKAKITQFIDDHLRGVPSFAIAEAAREADRLGQTALHMVELGQRAFLGLEDETSREIVRLEREFRDSLCDPIERFVDGVIAEGGIDSAERKRCFQIKNINVDLDRVADHSENLAEAAQDRIYHRVPFSDDALQDLQRAFVQAQLSPKMALAAFRAGDQDLAKQACRLEDEMDHIALSVRQGQLDRVRQGVCHPEADVLFVETVRNLERISDHAENIAVSVLRKH